MEDTVTCCAICGGPLGTRDSQYLPDWMHSITVLQINGEVSEFVEQAINSTSNVQQEDLDLRAFGGDEISSYGLGGTPQDPDADHFFPFHYSCDEIAQRFLSYATEQTPSSARSTSMIRDWPDLFLALETQYDIEVHGLPDAAIMKLNWAHKYYGAARFQDQVPFRVRNSDGWIRIPASKVYEADPQELDATEVTTFILSFMRRMPLSCTIGATPETSEKSAPKTLAKHMKALPTELQTLIFESFLSSPLEDLSLECTRQFNPEAWFNLIPQIAPWLFEPDLFQLPSVEGEGLTDWDWEHLARMLSQTGAFEPGGCMGKGAPAGLRNRRRIWRVLAEMEAPRGEWRA
ncbi:hypothetical protein MMC28_000438 [Mycoblastus sanguinarius]|nr:hypothetical protein [Mycoblastus sanguinarius]